jgi:hypothetical protein
VSALSDEGATTISNLWRFYDEHASQARQHETLRANVTSTLAAIAAAIVALAGVGGLSRADVPAGLVVVLFGALGIALSLKHYEHNRLHTKIMHEIRTHIDSAVGPDAQPSQSTVRIREAGKTKHNATFRVWRRENREQRAGPAEPLRL